MSTSSDSISNSDSSDASSDSNGSSTDGFDSSSSSDDDEFLLLFSSSEEMLSEDDDNLPEDARMERRSKRWPLSEGMLGDVFDTSDDETKHWGKLPEDVRDANWISEIRMSNGHFLELLESIEVQLDIVDGRRGYGTYAPKDRLFVTLSFLAHSPSLRYMRGKFGVPQNSISVCILRPTVAALKAVMVTGPNREFRWPVTVEEQQHAMAEFRDLWQLPGVIGAIDGTLIAMRKPSVKQGGVDTDSWLGYKGSIASLLLAVVSATGRFIYVSAGYPGCFGDAGAFNSSLLKQKLDAGLLSSTWSSTVGEHTRTYHPFLVGDAAFPLSSYMQKCFGNVPAENTREGKYNRCIINCRREVERAFGRLKGRWVFCMRNTFWGCPKFTKDCHLVCCALHNYLEHRNEVYVVQAPANIGVAQQEQVHVHANDGNVNAAGESLRQFLASYCALHC